VLEARFLFDDDEQMYLRDLLDHISALADAKLQIRMGLDEETMAEYKAMAQSHRGWIINQGWDDRVGIRRFEPFLK
jgi:hypothetical protein